MRAVESGGLFSLDCNIFFQNLNKTLKEAGGGAMGIIADNYSLGPPAVIFKTHTTFARELNEAGLELQPAKSKCYVSEDHRDDAWNEMRGDIPNGTLKDRDGLDVLEGGQPIHGISVRNVPVGSEIYVKRYLEKKAGKIKCQFDEISTMLDPSKWSHPEVPTRQMLWLLTVVCL